MMPFARYIPNTISIIRLISIIPTLWLFLRGEFFWTLILMMVSTISDGLDGYLARKFNLASRIGSLLDPIADKVLISTFFIVYAFYNYIPLELMIIVIGRDLLILTGYINLRLIEGPFDAKPDPLSKVNTFVEFIFILLIVVNLLLDLNPLVVETFAGLVIALSLLSLIKYVLIWSERVLKALRLVN
jgi:cardiolipin synthase